MVHQSTDVVDAAIDSSKGHMSDKICRSRQPEGLSFVVDNREAAINSSNVLMGDNIYRSLQPGLSATRDDQKVAQSNPKQVILPATTYDQENDDSSSGSAMLFLPLKRKRIHIIEEKMFLPRSVQTELTSEEIDLLFQHYQEAVQERNQLLLKISTLVIDVKFFENDDTKTRFYTGLTTWKLLDSVFKLVEIYLPEHGNAKLSPFQMFVLTLMKLRLNLTFTDLGYRFQVDDVTVSRYFHKCIYILFRLFHGSQLLHWPERSNLSFNTPNYFRCAFKGKITIIVDCFEIFIERSSVLRALAQGWSTYKHGETLKYLIGISITGAILFISEGFGGRASDKYVVTHSGFLDNIQEGDIILADKGFLIEAEVEEKGASLHLPCFVKNGEQLTPLEVEETRRIANVRIHVERIISVLRQKFNICSDHVPMSAISKRNDLFEGDLYDKIVFVCCCLVNLCPSVVRHDFEI